MSMEKALKKKKQLAWLNRLKGALKAEEACKETDDESSGDEKFVSKCVKKRSKEKKKTKISSLESKSLESKTCFPTLEKTPATLNKIKNIKKSSGISRTKSLNEKPKKRSIPQESLAGEPTKSVVPIKRKRKLQQGAETQVSKERKTVKKVVEREKSLEHVIERPHVERNGKPDHAVSTITPKAKANSSDKIFRAPEVIPKRPTQGATLIDKKSKLEGENKPTQMRPISNETVTATSIDSVKPQEKDEKLSFMIPKKCIQSATDKEFRLTQSHTNGDRSGSNDQGQHSAVLSDCIAQPNTTSFLGKSCLGEEDMQFLTLAKVHNSFWSACHEKERLLPSTKYAVVNEDGQVSPEPCERQMHCAPILTMKGSKDKYPPNFFGIVPTQKKSTAESSEKASPTQVEGPSPLDPPEPEPTELGATYQKLNFRNRGDRQWYQKSMYGICFTPLFLRQPSTLLARRMKFVRKSTGFRFNTKRDKEELIQAIQQRYKVNESIPRVDIPPRNWQLMMKSEVSTVYLQYRNREDALIASQTMHDDTGQLLLFKDSNVYQQDSRIRTPDAQMNVKRGDAHPNFAYPNHNRRSRSRSSSRASAPRHRSRSRDVQDVQHRPGRVNGKDASPNVSPQNRGRQRSPEDGYIPPLLGDVGRPLHSAPGSKARNWNPRVREIERRVPRSTLGWRNDRDISGPGGRMERTLSRSRSRSRSRSHGRNDRAGAVPGRYPRPSIPQNNRDTFFRQKNTHQQQDGMHSFRQPQYDRQDSRDTGSHTAYHRSALSSYQVSSRQ